MKNKKILVIDNYDSFTYTLVDCFKTLRAKVLVIKNDDAYYKKIINKFLPDAIVISPGPMSPSESKYCSDIIKKYYKTMPMLGVCLGMQILNEVFGGETVLVKNPIHGKTSLIHHNKDKIFFNIKSPFNGARYHSLQLSNLNECFDVIAVTDKDIIMGIKHKKYNLYGVLFHPESFLTEHGYKLLKNFLKNI
jgi:anthranilate synthase/aminodeoxychorismate synthase-like glutamine amidotransferase